MSSHLDWWQKEIIYQIYPRSFQDSNGDGIGDLPGILRRIDYVKSLNVNTVWLSPIFPSPMYDFGYDVADYCGIHPIFGTMDDFDRLLAEVHDRGMHLILDLVPNHTSHEHPWFQESRRSRDNPKRDWYIWADPAPGSTAEMPIPPNNWLSFFGGPAWTFDAATGQFYLHQFESHQPELNYRNPAVLEAMLDNMRFWLDKGVDGFRVDVIWLLLKDELLRDEPPDPDWDGVVPHNSLMHIHTQNLPGTHDIIKEMRAVTDEYARNAGRSRLLIGEIYLPLGKLVEYYGPDADECHLPYNFQLILLPWEAQVIRRNVDLYERLVPEWGWPNWVLGNHDQHRVATRLGQAQSRVAHMLMLALRGTPTLYYGDEIGMENVEIPPQFVQDPQALNQPELAEEKGRDPERTPMQWDDSPRAGFTEGGVTPWLPLADDYKDRNVAAQEGDPHSMLSFIRSLTALRQAEPALYGGDYASLDAANAPEHIFSFLRSQGEERFLVVLNFTGDPCSLDFSELGSNGEISISTSMDRNEAVDLRAVQVGPDEGIIVRV